MPSRNITKDYITHSYYHIYNRGVNKQTIFHDDQDYQVFLGLLKRYLSKTTQKDTYGRDGVTFYDDIELLAFCLMPNHYHLLIYVNERPRAMSELMRRIGTSYTMYYNKKYQRVGNLFQSRFKASRITNEPYLLHISRYIHRNPQDYYNWQYSSYPYYIKNWVAEWVRPQKIYDLYEWGTYEDFVNDHDNFNEMRDEIENELASD